MNRLDKIRGSLLASALGDGFGAVTEFMNVENILKTWHPNGLEAPIGNPILVTDDTQMAIAVAKALAQTLEDGFSFDGFCGYVVEEFVLWLDSPDNDRAPGRTCLTACRSLARGTHWTKATERGSKGCGANMRVAPVAYPSSLTDLEVAKLAQLQSAVTHAHPTALAASDLTAMAIRQLLNGLEPRYLLSFLLDYAQTQRLIYHEDILENSWQNPWVTSPEEFIERGWEETIAALKKIQPALEKWDRTTDPCLWTGEGWIAEEAMATGLLCFLAFPEDIVKNLQRAVVTKGDSDSIACLSGAFGGAYLGAEALPQEWVERLEYLDILETLAVRLNR